MLSQNHSWNGLTRPARINDNLPPAAAGSPEQRCRVDSQPGTLAALRTRPGHERGAPGAARWVFRGLGRERGAIRAPGTWRPGREEGVGREPLRASGRARAGAQRLRPHLRRCGQPHHPSGDPLARGGGNHKRSPGGVCTKFQTRARAGAERTGEPGAGAPEPMEGRAAAAAYFLAKCEKESGTLREETPFSFSLSVALSGRLLGVGTGEGQALPR